MCGGGGGVLCGEETLRLDTCCSCVCGGDRSCAEPSGTSSCDGGGVSCVRGTFGAWILVPACTRVAVDVYMASIVERPCHYTTLRRAQAPRSASYIYTSSTDKLPNDLMTRPNRMLSDMSEKDSQK